MVAPEVVGLSLDSSPRNVYSLGREGETDVAIYNIHISRVT